ncbi:MAG: hypothetical protein KOO62_04960 [candidate division Zixibacteria bacterium]|nr:hypothetical protein [candidate division Zixibacteria bacterium]
MKRALLILIVIMLATGAVAQETFYSMFSYTHYVPSVLINDRSVSLQSDLYPQWYHEHSAVRDMRWVRQNDSAITAFWEIQGDTILHILCELSGVEWQESDIDIHLVRYFPSMGSSEPLIIPLGGIMTGALIEAVPTDRRLKLNLVYQLAKRILAQTVQPRFNVTMGIAGHPLMRPGPYRRDNLALLLALATCENVLGMDSTFDAFQSNWWQRQAPGREILKRHFLQQWILTPEQTLADWITQEPYGSHLVALTRPPRLPQRTTAEPPKHFVEGLPLKGLLGFSVSIDSQGFLVVDSMDIYRLGYACGLRSDDRIRTVDAVRVRSHKTLVEKIFETYSNGGATLRVVRDDQTISVIIQPMLLPWLEDDEEYYDDEYFMDDYPIDPDSLPVTTDSVSSDYFDD